MYLHLLSRLDHHEKCTPLRCVGSCDVAEFLDSLQQPLLLVDTHQHQQEQQRLEALARGEIPTRGAM